MKILFVCSSNKSGQPNGIVFNQAESLNRAGVEITFYAINGGGVKGYIKHIFLLRKYLKVNHFDILHAHYSLSAFTASFAKRRPLVVSLMGSDAYLSGVLRKATSFFYRYKWDVTIVKSKEMRDLLNFKKALVIPNGVDIERFTITDQKTARLKIGLPLNDKIIVFIADPSRVEKNFPLAEESVKLLNRSDIRFIPVFNIPNSTIPDYMNAADILLLTSKWEGSVNVVKEAMACNLPIVSTDVGDVRHNILGVDGCYIAQSNPHDICSKLSEALEYNKRTNGREKLIAMELDSKSVAQKIIKIYEGLLK